MKPKHLALPALALVLAGILLRMQRKEAAALREGNAGLRERIAGLRERIAGALDAAYAEEAPPIRPRDKPAAGSEPIDWKKIAGEIGDLKKQDGVSEMRSMMALKKQLLAMEPWELLAALDEIAALGVDDETCVELEELILSPLAKKGSPSGLYAISQDWDLSERGKPCLYRLKSQGLLKTRSVIEAS